MYSVVSYPYTKVIEVSKVFQKGKTQVPEEVREMLKVVDGDKLVWIASDGKIIVEGSKRRGREGRYQPTR